MKIPSEFSKNFAHFLIYFRFSVLIFLLSTSTVFSQASITAGYSPHCVWKMDGTENIQMFIINQFQAVPLHYEVHIQEDWANVIHLYSPTFNLMSPSNGQLNMAYYQQGNLWSKGDISNPGTGSIWVLLRTDGLTPRCATFHIVARILNSANQEVATATQTVIANPYVTSPSNNSERVAILSTADLFIRDNLNDIGAEPFLTGSFNPALITGSQNGINNRLFDNSGIFENPTRSIASPLNPNYMRVDIFNRSCQTTSSSTLDMNWTIARFHEPWAHDWRNFNRGSHYTDNKVVYSSNNYPMGNEITISDPWTYSSSDAPMTISGMAPGESVTASKSWIVPDPIWYKNGTYATGVGQFPMQFNSSTATPVICLLATLHESWRTYDGYYFPASTTSKVDIVDYANNNNNVATRNTFILNSANGYKWVPTNGNPRGRGGQVVVNPRPNIGQPVNIGIRRDTSIYDSTGVPVFTDHGHIIVYLDEFLWNRWVEGGYQGRNITIVDDQVIKLTNPNFATIENIDLEEDEMGWITVEPEFYGSTPPNVDYQYSFNLGSIDIDNDDILVGSPTNFIANVLHVSGIADEEEELGGFEFTSVGKATSSAHKINIYPNPSRDFITIDFRNLGSNKVVATIVNLQGQLVKEYSHSGSMVFKLPIDDISDGAYFVTIKSEESHFEIFKFIKN